MARLVLASTAAGVASWQAYVLYDAQPKELKRTPMGTLFFPGSLDDRIMDSLDSGDVILFRKPWYKQLLWGAVTTLLRQEVAHSMFDHMGVVIVDEKGQALVLECTCSGIKLRPYDERILRSRALEISARRLRTERTPKMRVRLLEWAKRAQGHAYPFHVDELRAPLMPDSARSVEDSLQHMAHPAAALVYDAWRALGVMPNSARPSKLAMSKDFAPRAFAETIDGVRMKPLIPVRQDVTK